jgi:hypothetical protein
MTTLPNQKAQEELQQEEQSQVPDLEAQEEAQEQPSPQHERVLQQQVLQPGAPLKTQTVPRARNVSLLHRLGPLGQDKKEGGSTSYDKNAIKEALLDRQFEKECIQIIKPALLNDVKDMIRGRVLWRRASVLAETMGKASSAAASVLAFASASDLAGGEASRIIGFVSGSVGTLGMVLLMFANFSRSQSIERSDAINLILKDANMEEIPDIATELVVNGDSQQQE